MSNNSVDHKELNSLVLLTQQTIRSLKEGLKTEQNKLNEFEKHIAVIEAGGKSDYDLAALKNSIDPILLNISNIEKVLEDEQTKLITRRSKLKTATDILKAHGKCVPLMLNNEHDWKIEEIFPMTGNWKKRSCRFCGTQERLGHG